MDVKQFLKNWALPISMLIGALGYFAFAALPLQQATQHAVKQVIVHYLQPVMLFCMLFLSFVKVSPKEMRPRRWHLWLLLIQAGWFLLFSGLAICIDRWHLGGTHADGLKVLAEGAMLAFICPTATASAVITGKLGGSTSGVVTYLIVCNLMVSLVAPAVFPLVEPQSGHAFLWAFLTILRKVFPLLICPLFLAWMVRYCLPSLHRLLLRYPDLSFRVWTISLALAITVTVHSIVMSTVSVWYLVGLAFISCLCCLIQFYLGKRLGSRYSRELRITAGQAFGQKNTVLIIWMGQVFLDPVTSVVGGFYSVWHNTVNSYQLYKARRG